MTLIYEGRMPDGTFLHIEDWSANYPLLKDKFIVAGYPVSKWTLEGAFAPKAGRNFRLGIGMESRELAMAAVAALESGEKTLADFYEQFERREYLPCVTGRNEDAMGA